MTYQFQVEGRIKPYVRMTRRGKYVKPQAIEYISSQEGLKLALKQQMVEHGYAMLPGQTPLEVNIFIQPAKHNRDLDNEAKAILDAMTGVVFPDDRWVDQLWVSREPGCAVVHILVSAIKSMEHNPIDSGQFVELLAHRG